MALAESVAALAHDDRTELIRNAQGAGRGGGQARRRARDYRDRYSLLAPQCSRYELAPSPSYAMSKRSLTGSGMPAARAAVPPHGRRLTARTAGSMPTTSRRESEDAGAGPGSYDVVGADFSSSGISSASRPTNQASFFRKNTRCS